MSAVGPSLASPEAVRPDPDGWRMPIVLLACWFSAVIVGMYMLIAHSYICGPRGENPRRWPADSTLIRSETCPTLLVFFHPLCPCSKATLEELTRLLTKHKDKISVHIAFACDGNSLLLAQSSLYRDAKDLPGVHVVEDTSGAEAQRFGAATSGHVFLYSPSGRLLFEGGITPARGHEGGNLGTTAIHEWLASGRSTTTTAPVFGCELVAPRGSTGKGGAR